MPSYHFDSTWSYTQAMLVFPTIDPVIVPLIGQLAIRWYGLMYLLGFVLAYLYLKQQNSKFSKDFLADIFFYFAFGIIIGGRVGYQILYADNTSFWQLWQFWAPGRSFHGGLLGALLALLFLSRKNSYKLLEITDFIAPAIPIGLGLGRIGNFLNGELWGRASDLPWAMVFPHVDSFARHPSQLYEFLLEGVLLFFLLHRMRRKNLYLGQMSGVFLLGYGSLRFLVEFVREPDFTLQLLSHNSFTW